MLDAFNDPNDARVFDGVAMTRKRLRQVGFDTCGTVLNPKVDSERQKKLSIFVHISELDVFRSCIVDELAAEVERPLLAESRQSAPCSPVIPR
ncbi:hypothetical protein WT11_33610 [Burkholderia stagnalis]|nr:hypothetical protein WT11_33610 [Burkholderia stagnalis]